MPQTPIQVMSPAEVRQIAADLMVLSFPLLLVDMVRRTHPLGGNRIWRLPGRAGLLAPGLADDDPRTLITSAWLDVSQEIVTIDWPADDAGRLSAVLYDPWGRRIGPLQPPPSSGRLTVVGANWLGNPEGRAVWRLPANAGWMITRATPRTPGEYESDLDLLMRQSIEAPHPWPAQEIVAIEGPSRSVVESTLSLEPGKFLYRLAALIARYPPPHAQAAEALRSLGFAPGAPHPEPPPDARIREAFGWGIRDGADEIAEAASQRLTNTRGWRVLHAPPADDTPLSRAAAAAASLGAPTPEDLLCFICDSDSEGRPLRGSSCYRLSFSDADIPPAGAGWNLSLRATYHSRELATEPRSLGGDGLAEGPDGSVEILIQHAAPTEGESNWLPTPPADFALLLRLHRPSPSALDGAWAPPEPKPLSRSSTEEGRPSSQGA